MRLYIRPSNDTILREVMTEVPDPCGQETFSVAVEMLKVMTALNGAGLACPQVGVRWRMVMTYFGVFIDPKVVWESPQTAKMEEGCLSFPGEFHVVERPEKVRVEAVTLAKGNFVSMDLDGLEARVIQHEIDHINGKLFNDQ